MMSDGEHPSMYLLSFVCFSLQKCLLESFACVLIRLFGFLLLSFRSSFYILDTNSLSDMWFANKQITLLQCLMAYWNINLLDICIRGQQDNACGPNLAQCLLKIKFC